MMMVQRWLCKLDKEHSTHSASRAADLNKHSPPEYSCKHLLTKGMCGHLDFCQPVLYRIKSSDILSAFYHTFCACSNDIHMFDLLN